MRLYFASETCSLSPHIVLQELGMEYDLVRVNNRTKRTSEGGDFLAVNPKGYVAALELDDGEVLTEGPALVQYLADLNPQAGLAPPHGTLERTRLQEWLNFITSEIHAGSSPLFNRDLPETVRDMFQTRLSQRLSLLDVELTSRSYLMGGSFTVADAYLFTVLNWMPALGVELARWHHLLAYMTRISTRPSVVAALAREAEIPLVAL